MQKGQVLIFFLLFITLIAFIIVIFYGGILTQNPPSKNPVVTSEPPKPSLETSIPTLSPAPTSTFSPTLIVNDKNTSQQLNYPHPSSWKTVVIGDLSLCLPPKWEVSKESAAQIIFNRDPGYKPNVAMVNSYNYKGGSRRDEYINTRVQYEYEPDQLKSKTKVSELEINGQSVLQIAIPTFPEALVFVLKNKLYAVELSSWNLVNDSKVDFYKDIYTMIGCAK